MNLIEMTQVHFFPDKNIYFGVMLHPLVSILGDRAFGLSICSNRCEPGYHKVQEPTPKW